MFWQAKLRNNLDSNLPPVIIIRLSLYVFQVYDGQILIVSQIKYVLHFRVYSLINI